MAGKLPLHAGAAVLPDPEFAGATEAVFARVEPEHDFAERQQVVFIG